MNYNIILAYAPQQGYSQELKDKFWNTLDQLLRKIPAKEEIILAGDLNGHVGDDRNGVER
jgi:hypothetical protein